MGAAAPLIATDQAPVPPGAQSEWFEGAGGLRLRAVLCESPNPRGAVVLSPGRTEAIEKYFEVIGELRARGFTVFTHDWRGQGLSGRLLANRLAGHATGFADFLSDFRALLDAYEARLPRPWISLAHSMGGALALLAMVRGETRFSGAALSAAMLGIATGPASPAVARAAVWLMLAAGRGSALTGGYPHPAEQPFEGNHLTHDRGRFERWQTQLRAGPDLALGPPTWSWVDFALKASAAIAAPGALEAIDVPVLLAAAGEERLVLNSAIRAAARRLPHARYLEIEGARHELLMETDVRRAQFWAAFDELAAEALARGSRPA